jgi:hypothetical protein
MTPLRSVLVSAEVENGVTTGEGARRTRYLASAPIKKVLLRFKFTPPPPNIPARRDSFSARPTSLMVYGLITGVIQPLSFGQSQLPLIPVLLTRSILVVPSCLPVQPRGDGFVSTAALSSAKSSASIYSLFGPLTKMATSEAL